MPFWMRPIVGGAGAAGELFWQIAGKTLRQSSGESAANRDAEARNLILIFLSCTSQC
jgi:hypothetical protein